MVSPMKRLLPFLALLAAPLLTHAAKQPNILFIFLDDFGWKDTSYMGSDFYETPHIDKLARGGMIFTDAYSAAANCAPARAGLLSGQYSPRHEVYNVGTGARGNAKHRKLQHIPGTSTLRPDITTWAACAQQAGYTTATMGKWHLSKDPLPYGFDINVGGTHSGGPPKGYYPPHPIVPGLKDAPADEYVTDTLSKKACAFIREQEKTDKPWLLYLTHFAVHTPIQGPKDLKEKYQNKKPGTLHNHPTMAGMIESVDRGVGWIMDTINELGIAKDTAVIFFSDNGGYGPATSMAPLKGYKGTYYEGGIREPFFIHWPGHVAPGTTSSEPIIGVDLYPTLLAMTGAKAPKNHILDGENLVPLFTGAKKSLDRKAIYWHFPAYLQSYQRFDEQPDPLFRARPCSVVRAGKWKLIHYFEDDRVELFDLLADLGENQNRAKQHPDKVRELRALLDSWRTATNAPIPDTPNPAYNAQAEKVAIEKALAKVGQKKKK